MQVTSQIHAFRIPFTIPIAPDRRLDRFVYVYALLGDREVWLIDSGVATTERLVAAWLGEIGRNLGEVSTLLLTHSHPDHIGAAAAIQSATGCHILIHEAERPWLENVSLQRGQRPVPGFDELVGGSARVTHTIAGGDRLTLDSHLSLEVLHTPGHSAGSVSFWIENERLLISGDAVISPGDLPIYDDYRLCLASVEQLASLDDVEILLSSWDEPKHAEAVGQRFQQARDYLRQIDDAVRLVTSSQPHLDPMDLCRQVASKLGLPPAAVNPLVARSLMSHRQRP